MPIRLALLFLSIAPISVNAQNAGGVPPMTAADMAAMRSACEELARLPNPPMSVEACKAMLSLGAGLEAAASDPRARRPGDESMTCAAIFGELKTLAVMEISEASHTRADAMVTESTALARRQAAELSTFIAESYAVGAVAGVVGAFTPNFVGAALSAAWQARLVGMATRQAAEQAPVRAQMNEAILANVGELVQSMQANPRFARVVELGANKNCEPPADALK